MKYIQPQFHSLIHRLCALLPAARTQRSAPVIVQPPVRWQQLELNFQRQPEVLPVAEGERQSLVRAHASRHGAGLHDLEKSA